MTVYQQLIYSNYTLVVKLRQFEAKQCFSPSCDVQKGLKQNYLVVCSKWKVLLRYLSNLSNDRECLTPDKTSTNCCVTLQQQLHTIVNNIVFFSWSAFLNNYNKTWADTGVSPGPHDLKSSAHHIDQQWLGVIQRRHKQFKTWNNKA